MHVRFQSAINLLPFDGDLYLISRFYELNKADDYFQRLHQQIDWQSEQLFIYGRWVSVPRLMAWYGDAGAVYRYSGVDHRPRPWTTLLLQLKTELEQYCQCPFNSVLANLYRDGRDSMGCHADDEKQLGLNPQIASLSLGDSRRLRFRHPQSGYKLDLILEHGDLLWMGGNIQHHWRHELPKTRQRKGPRINLTFRNIIV